MSQEELENKNDVCVGPTSEQAGKASTCEGCPNQSQCSQGTYRNLNDKVDVEKNEILSRLQNVKYILLVLSGKGGVGKSTISSQLAFTLSYYGCQVGILDIDVCGPSIAHMMGVANQSVHQSSFGWSPVYARDNLSVMSIAFLLQDKNDAIIWRGPRKTGLIKQFLSDVEWDALDFLIIDCPPGTSDEHISIQQFLSKLSSDHNNENNNNDSTKNENENENDSEHINIPKVYSVIVTTPQEISLLDVRKEISFCHKVKLPILGVIENMNGFICPCCHNKSEIFLATTGGAKKMCIDLNEYFLGSMPIDTNLLKCCDDGKCFIEQCNLMKDSKNHSKMCLEQIVEKILHQISPDVLTYVKSLAFQQPNKNDDNNSNNNNSNNNNDNLLTKGGDEN